MEPPARGSSGALVSSEWGHRAGRQVRVVRIDEPPDGRTGRQTSGVPFPSKRTVPGQPPHPGLTHTHTQETPDELPQCFCPGVQKSGDRSWGSWGVFQPGYSPSRHRGGLHSSGEGGGEGGRRADDTQHPPHTGGELGVLPLGSRARCQVPGEAGSEGSGAARPTSSSNPLAQAAFPGRGAASHPPKKPHPFLLSRAGPQAGLGRAHSAPWMCPGCPAPLGEWGCGGGGRGV